MTFLIMSRLGRELAGGKSGRRIPAGLPTWWLALLLFAVGPAHATQVVPPEFSRLVNQADYIVRGVVRSVRSEWRSTGGQRSIVTKVEIEVRQVIAGSPPTPLVLEMLGGKIGDEQMIVHGAPRFAVGDEDILFVHGNGLALNPLVAMGHGRYPISRDAKDGRETVRRANGDAMYSEQDVARPLAPGTPLHAESRPARPLTPEEFVEKILSARNPRAPGALEK